MNLVESVLIHIECLEQHLDCDRTFNLIGDRSHVSKWLAVAMGDLVLIRQRWFARLWYACSDPG